MSDVKRYTAWAAEVALPRGTMVVLATDYDALKAELATERLRADAAVGDANAAERRVAELERLLNTPHTAEWFEGVKFEAGHQITRWGADYDAGKAPADWFWLIGYLAQKAMIAQIAGDKEKACHHTISTGAAMLNWFRAIVGDSNAMRPGIDAALAGQQQQGEPCDLPPEGWFCTRSKGHEGPCAAVLHDWGVASYSLDLNWGNGRSAHDGQMTMEQYGAICRVLSPDWKGETEQSSELRAIVGAKP